MWNTIRSVVGVVVFVVAVVAEESVDKVFETRTASSWDIVPDLVCLARQFKSDTNGWDSYTPLCEGWDERWNARSIDSETLGLFQDSNAEIRTTSSSGLHVLVFDRVKRESG